MLSLFLPAIPTLGTAEELLWQGTEFLDARWLLRAVPAINPEH